MRLIMTIATAMVFALPASAEDGADDAAWLAGRWATTIAPVDGFETIAAEAPDCAKAVVIDAPAANLIHRTSILRNGKSATVTFSVRRNGDDYPLWSEEGEGQLALIRKVDDDTFDLAALDQTGRPDWNHAWRHLRCPLH